MKQLFKIALLLFLLISNHTNSQNLVPNPSFEIFIDCSTDFYPISNATNWSGMQTPDYFNSCIVPMGPACTDVPKNSFGFQFPKTGNGYGGIVCYYATDFREYIQVKLNQKLSSGVNYCVELNISLADTSKWAIDKLGVYFSSDTNVYPYATIASPPFYSFTNYIPQIESDTLMTDTVNWKSIEGILLGTGNEEYMTIGNFRNDSTTDTITIRGNSPSPLSYYYIDDISVEKVLNAHAGNDTSITTADSVQIGNNPTENATYLWQPATGLSDLNAANPMARPNTTTTYIVTKTQCSVVTTDTVVVTNLSVGIDEDDAYDFKIYPNPANNEITVDFDQLKMEKYDFSIINVLGQYQNIKMHNNSAIIDVSNLGTGVYFVKAINKTTKTTLVTKFIKN